MNRQEWIDWMNDQTGYRLHRLCDIAKVDFVWVERDKNYEVQRYGFRNPKKFKTKRSAVRYIKRLILKKEFPLPKVKFVTSAVRKEKMIKDEQEYFDRLGI